MTDITKDVGVATALLTEFTEHRLPRALALRDKVERGEKLEDLDIAFMKEVLSTAQRIQPLVDQHPEYQAIYAQAAQIHAEIIEKALANEESERRSGM